MKVNVITIGDVQFGRLQWWSNWFDIAVYDYNHRPWLIQMRVSRTNKKKFRSVPVTGAMYRQALSSNVGDLTQMNCREQRK